MYSTNESRSILVPTASVIASLVVGGYVVGSMLGGIRRSKINGTMEDEDDLSSYSLKYQPYEPPATWKTDMQVLQAMWFAKITGTDLQERLDSFYEDQADLYDSYRFRMLHGRPKMLRGVAMHVQQVPPASSAPDAKKQGIVWVDLACGTGANVENLGQNFATGKIEKVYLVDLCRPLCEVARRERGGKYGAEKVRVIHGDVTEFDLPGLPPPGTAHLVTISYSLVMIPDWKRCIAHAKRLLRPGGIIGVADFTVAPDQSKMMQSFWTQTFAKDHVFLNAEHLPTLKEEFEELESDYGYGTLPYTPPFLQAAYYHFVGTKRKE